MSQCFLRVTVFTVLMFLFALQILEAQEMPLANLENPKEGSTQSGIGAITGWVCSAQRVEIEVDGFRVQSPYGTGRGDTLPVCQDVNNGFAYLLNWNNLGEGKHTVRVFADEVEFGRATFTVKTLKAKNEFLRGVQGVCTVENFPEQGQNTPLVWEESLQNFVIGRGERVGGGYNSTPDNPKKILENPTAGSFQSGLGIISGWACDAQRIEIETGGITVEAAYGSARGDTLAVCGDTNNGFVYLVNWNLLGTGLHALRVLADGKEFAKVDVTVTRLGDDAFLTGLTGECTAKNFPLKNMSVGLRWQESLQNFVVEDLFLSLEGQLLSNPTAREPITNATISTESGASVRVDEQGRFLLPSVIGPPCPLIAGFADGRQNIYRLNLDPPNAGGPSPIDSAAGAVAELFTEPVAGQSRTVRVSITPTLEVPAGGSVVITQPRDEAMVKCAPLPQDCRFAVRGTASPLLGTPGSPFTLFLAVKPRGGKVVPQFPPVNVDTRTGDWVAEAQLGGGQSPAREGEEFEILAFVTDSPYAPVTKKV